MKNKTNLSEEYIQMICHLYGDIYDDREEDTSIGGADWVPGVRAEHKSLSLFQQELEDAGIELSTSKIRKILITGGYWSTATSRKIEKLYAKYHSISKVAEEMNVSSALVTMYLPYERVVYDLENKSSNAKRIDRWRERKKNQ